MSHADNMKLLYAEIRRIADSELAHGNDTHLTEFWMDADNLVTALIRTQQLSQADALIEEMRTYAPRLTALDPDTAIARLDFRKSMIAQMAGVRHRADANARAAYERICKVIKRGGEDAPHALYLHICGSYVKNALLATAANRILPFYREVKKHYTKLKAPAADVTTAYVQFCGNVTEALLANRLTEQAITVADEAMALLNTLPEDNLTLDVGATIASALGSTLFQTGEQARATDYLLAAYGASCRMHDDPPFSKAFRIAKHGFNCANVLFQTDRNDEAAPIFESVLAACYNEQFPQRDVILRYAADYYAQLLVAAHDYKGAVAQYERYLDAAPAEMPDELLRNCANFSYRIAYIYAYFLYKDALSKSFLARATEYLDRIALPSAQDESMRSLVNQGF